MEIYAWRKNLKERNGTRFMRVRRLSFVGTGTLTPFLINQMNMDICMYFHF
jgi:hypothetical protein